MQEQMEGAEHEFNELDAKLNPPVDWQQPIWTDYEKFGDWKDYASEDLQNEWPNLTGRARMIIASNLNDISINI